mmetsp:Transcript_26500/g.106105  ORF Transcript_26500/g.106105 Transcript_26500/m.106105 type:complete len:202 (+) Transcript_26500:1265-1870(+)
MWGSSLNCAFKAVMVMEMAGCCWSESSAKRPRSRAKTTRAEALAPRDSLCPQQPGTPTPSSRSHRFFARDVVVVVEESEESKTVLKGIVGGITAPAKGMARTSSSREDHQPQVVVVVISCLDGVVTLRPATTRAQRRRDTVSTPPRSVEQPQRMSIHPSISRTLSPPSTRASSDVRGAEPRPSAGWRGPRRRRGQTNAALW